MPTAIEKIQAKAKALRKSYPNAKWTDLIKKASTDLKKIGAIGGVSKKKKATKKAATKKTVSKRKPKIVKVLKQHGTSAKAYDKRHQALPAGRRISKGGKPYTETRSNRSDKGVLLGINIDTDAIINRYKNVLKEIEKYQETKRKIKIAYSVGTKQEKAKSKLMIKKIDDIIRELKVHSRQIKSYI